MENREIVLRVPSSGGGAVFSNHAHEIGALLLKSGYKVWVEVDPKEKERLFPWFLIHLEESEGK